MHTNSDPTFKFVSEFNVDDDGVESDIIVAVDLIDMLTYFIKDKQFRPIDLFYIKSK